MNLCEGRIGLSAKRTVFCSVLKTLYALITYAQVVAWVYYYVLFVAKANYAVLLLNLLSKNGVFQSINYLNVLVVTVDLNTLAYKHQMKISITVLIGHIEEIL